MAISEKDLQAEITDLSDEIAPERDLWPGIEKAIQLNEQIKPERTVSLAGKKTLNTPVSWAASIVAAVLLTWVGVDSFQNPNASSLNASVVSQMHKDFEEQRMVMLASYGQQNTQTISADMQAQLEQLAKARASIENALKEDENNTDLIDLLRWTQQQELELIERLYSPQWQTI